MLVLGNRKNVLDGSNKNIFKQTHVYSFICLSFNWIKTQKKFSLKINNILNLLHFYMLIIESFMSINIKKVIIWKVLTFTMNQKSIKF